MAMSMLTPRHTNLRSWASRYAMPTAIMVGVIVGALFLLYVGLVSVGLE